MVLSLIIERTIAATRHYLGSHLYGNGSDDVNGSTPVGVAPGTSPAVVQLAGGGFQVVFNASGSDTLWRYGVGTGTYTGSTPVGLAAGTSPSIAALISG